MITKLLKYFLFFLSLTTLTNSCFALSKSDKKLFLDAYKKVLEDVQEYLSTDHKAKKNCKNSKENSKVWNRLIKTPCKECKYQYAALLIQAASPELVKKLVHYINWLEKHPVN